LSVRHLHTRAGWRARGAALGLGLAIATAAALAGAAEAPAEHSLEALMQGMAGTPGVVARFREVKELALLTAPLESRGTLYFAPPDRLARIVEEPGRSRLVIDGKRLLFHDAAGGEEVDLSDNPIAREYVSNFIVLFNGDLAALRERYAPSFRTDGPRWTLELLPRSRPLSDFVERVTLRGEGRALTRMELLESDGDRTTTWFDEVEIDHRFDAAESERIFAPSGPPAERR
jgi:outer membrane lipoprotein-sorting protein